MDKTKIENINKLLTSMSLEKAKAFLEASSKGIPSEELIKGAIIFKNMPFSEENITALQGYNYNPIQSRMHLLIKNGYFSESIYLGLSFIEDSEDKDVAIDTTLDHSQFAFGDILLGFCFALFQKKRYDLCAFYATHLLKLNSIFEEYKIDTDYLKNLIYECSRFESK